MERRFFFIVCRLLLPPPYLSKPTPIFEKLTLLAFPYAPGSSSSRFIIPCALDASFAELITPRGSSSSLSNPSFCVVFGGDDIVEWGETFIYVGLFSRLRGSTAC